MSQTSSESAKDLNEDQSNAFLINKWSAIIDSDKYEKVTDPTKRAVLARVLENFQNAKLKQSKTFAIMTESTATVSTSSVAGYDAVLMSMIRRSLPQNIAFETCGVQNMDKPTGLIMALKARYGEGRTTSPEALYDEANTAFSGTGKHEEIKPDGSNYNEAEHGVGWERELGELLSTEGNSEIATMGLTVESLTVIAKTRKLKAHYSLEVEQDMQALHGLSIATEMVQILTEEATQEINREVLRTMYNSAQIGATGTSKAGEFNMLKDSGGRHMVERFKGLVFQIEKEANAIAQFTRRGRGNFIVCSPNVASALSMAGYLDGSYATKEELIVDPANHPFAGVLHSKYKVFIDYYFPSSVDFVCVGYKGANQYDAGMFYCPYVPFQTFDAVDPNNFQPIIGLQTRYGLVPHPFAQKNVQDVSENQWEKHKNGFYRIFKVTGIEEAVKEVA